MSNGDEVYLIGSCFIAFHESAFFVTKPFEYIHSSCNRFVTDEVDVKHVKYICSAKVDTKLIQKFRILMQTGIFN